MPSDPIILAMTKSGSIYEVYNLEVIMNIIIRSSRDPRNLANDPDGGRDPQVENHCFKVLHEFLTEP